MTTRSCRCGHTFPRTLGAYGCPNCLGESGAAPLTFYGCHNRAPIQTVCAPACQYTYTTLGQTDPRCHGCKERHNA